MAASQDRSTYDLALSKSEAEILPEVIKKLDGRVNTRDGILAVTVQENHGGRYSSLIYNCRQKTFLANYPVEMKSQDKNFVVGRFIISYKENLEVPAEPSANQLNGYQVGEIFCCSAVTPYKPTPMAKNNLFKNFMAKKGTEEEIFEVTKQVNNGPDLSTKYVKLVNNDHVQIDVDTKSLQKIHSYWNMKCSKHNLFYKINLFSQREMYNEHHVRGLSTSKIDEKLLREFLNTAM